MRRPLLTYFIAVVFFVGLCTFVWPSVENEVSLPQRKLGEPIIITDTIVLENSRITQIVDDGRNMYVLADAYQGFVQVYDLNGRYIHTLSFFSHANGRFHLAVSDSTVYVSDKRKNIYILEEGVFQRYIPENDTTEDIKNLDFNTFSTRYEVRGASVWRVDKNDDVCVIRRSWIAFLYQTYMIIPLMLGFLALCFVVGRCFKPGAHCHKRNLHKN